MLAEPNAFQNRVFHPTGRFSSFPIQQKRQLFKKLLRSHLARLAKPNPLDHVDSPLSAQDVAHGGLAQFHFPGKLLLSQTRIATDSRHYF
jgi:hypothetical protein